MDLYAVKLGEGIIADLDLVSAQLGINLVIFIMQLNVGESPVDPPLDLWHEGFDEFV